MDDVPSLMSTVTVPFPAQSRAIHRPSPLASIGPPSAVSGKLTHVARVVPGVAGGSIDWGMDVDAVEGSAEDRVEVELLCAASGAVVQALNIGTRSTAVPMATASLRVVIRSPSTPVP